MDAGGGAGGDGAPLRRARGTAEPQVSPALSRASGDHPTDSLRRGRERSRGWDPPPGEPDQPRGEAVWANTARTCTQGTATLLPARGCSFSRSCRTASPQHELEPNDETPLGLYTALGVILKCVCYFVQVGAGYFCGCLSSRLCNCVGLSPRGRDELNGCV